MVAWQDSIRKLGKGTGKYAPRYRRDAQRFLNQCREAVPAWVMPLHRIWDTINPAPDMFDIIIVDEASQCGLEALPLFYLGKKILIVGDDKQISPDAIGVVGADVHRLMDEYLTDFVFKASFGIESSLFDHGRLRFGKNIVVLHEHFRCMPEIIRFSNDLCYQDTPLIPLRQYPRDRLKPLERVFVKNGYREGTNSNVVNRPEADRLVDNIVELCQDKRYEAKTMGVIELQGTAQAGIIETSLLMRLGAQEMAKRRLICGNPYSFQGDERDIIFLSMVAAPNAKIGAFVQPADERRFNVAASRARDQMWLFHSVTSSDLSVRCLRRKLLEFFENTATPIIGGILKDELERRAMQDNRSIIKAPPPFESWFEVDVALELMRKGFDVKPHFEVAGRWIDIVVEGGQARLAVECDGDIWHGINEYEADMERQRQLERCGWVFFRVRMSVFSYNKEVALQGLWQILEERGIHPRGFIPPQTVVNNMVEVASDLDTEEEFEEDEEITEDDPIVAGDTEIVDNPVSRRPQDITTAEIQKAIVEVLEECPHNSIKLVLLSPRVLREVHVLTHGNPRKEFAKRVLRSVILLERKGVVERYTATNERVRLVKRSVKTTALPEPRLF